MADLSKAQTQELVPQVGAGMPDTFSVLQGLETMGMNMRSFSPALAAAAFTPDFSAGGPPALPAACQIIAGTAAAFTINNPINPPAQSANGGPFLMLVLVNTTGGALGAITMGAAYHTAGAVTAPATGNRRLYLFINLGTAAAPVYYEISRSAADVPN